MTITTVLHSRCSLLRLKYLPTFTKEGIEKIKVLNNVSTFGFAFTKRKIRATRTIRNKEPSCPTSINLPANEKQTSTKSNLFHAILKYCFGPTPISLNTCKLKN